jgi:hypothetical protein
MKVPLFHRKDVSRILMSVRTFNVLQSHVQFEMRNSNFQTWTKTFITDINHRRNLRREMNFHCYNHHRRSYCFVASSYKLHKEGIRSEAKLAGNNN